MTSTAVQFAKNPVASDLKRSESPATGSGAAASTRGHFRPDIEGLRGVAVLVVVCYHAQLLWMTGGFVGVDVFFVLSGYLITGLLVKEHATNGRIDFAQFYGRRARRLLPAAAVVLAATLLAERLVLSPLEEAKFAWSALATALYASNLLFMRQAADYFAADAEANPFLHTWSLAVEEQFYLLWPLLVTIGLRGRRSQRQLLFVVFGVSLASFAVAQWLTEVRQPWAFFATPARAWEFGIGATACLIPLNRVPRAGLALLGWAGLSAILIAGWSYTPVTLFPGVSALLPVIGTAAVVVAGQALPTGGAARFLASRPLQFLGRQSYSWYLWHWPVLVLAGVWLPTIGTVGRVICACGSLALATLTQRLVENPIRFHKKLVRSPRLSLRLAALLTGTGALVAIGFHLWATHDQRSPSLRPIAEAAVAQPTVDLNGCILDFTEAEPRECVYGDSASATNIVLFGDSHAAQWFPALDPIARRHRWRLVTLLKSSCPPARVQVFNKRLRRNFSECSDWRERALASLQRLQPAVVIVASFSRREAAGLTSDGYVSTSYAAWESGTRSIISAILSTGARVVLVRDTPFPGFNVPICLARAAQHNRPSTDCRLVREQALDDGTRRSEERALRGLAGTENLDLSDQFCDSSVCDVVRRGMIVYRDNNHVSARFAGSLESVLEARLTPFVQARPSSGQLLGNAEQTELR